MFSMPLCDKAPISRINKLILQTNKKKKINTLFKKWAKDLNKHFTERRWSNALETYKETFNIINHNGLLPHPRIQSVGKDMEQLKRSHTLLIKAQNGQPLWKS